MISEWTYEAAFSRHAGLLTPDEQQRLRHSRVAIAGMGGVGGVHLTTLARLGVARFSIADSDWFEVVNFNRQYGARLSDIGRSKVSVMAEEVLRINPETDLRVFGRGIQEDNVKDFLMDADLFVDGIDFFEIGIRRQLFREAARMGIYAVTAAPLGFSTAWLVFKPDGMSFDEYFDLHDDQTPTEQLIAFLVGLAPGSLHNAYLDWSAVSLEERRGPSCALACQLCAAVVAAEAVRILTDRKRILCAPYHSQFDAYLGICWTGYMEDGNRNSVQVVARDRLRNLLNSGHRSGHNGKQ